MKYKYVQINDNDASLCIALDCVIFYKDNAIECNENLFLYCRVQLIFYKDT